MPGMTHPAQAGPRPRPATEPAAPADTKTLPLVGVIGGMGPLASAELLSTIYRLDPPPVEQRAPRVLLWSDPAVADRTLAINGGRLGPVAQALERSVGQLLAAGAHRVVVACVTAHHAVRLLPPALTSRCVSLVDLVFDELARRPARHLLLCTDGSRASGVFTGHERFAQLRERIVLPDAADQAALHQGLYRLKRGGDAHDAIRFLERTLPRYGASSFIAGCTELHLVTRAIEAAGRSAALPSIDPMALVARRIRDGVL
ncbi:aspartate/glutamate racemase family protein [Streptomyces sp. NPDC048182]|uniref:aspartate/glutamate racemase family protein n=1 Tax=unclassified Streptomyces TaxID=2593676 RepID=UPI0033AC002E